MEPVCCDNCIPLANVRYNIYDERGKTVLFSNSLDPFKYNIRRTFGYQNGEDLVLSCIGQGHHRSSTSARARVRTQADFDRLRPLPASPTPTLESVYRIARSRFPDDNNIEEHGYWVDLGEPLLHLFTGGTFTEIPTQGEWEEFGWSEAVRMDAQAKEKGVHGAATFHLGHLDVSPPRTPNPSIPRHTFPPPF
ncbi:hypothetical protein JCM8547_001966 [Rhodosporidiobolus lusitaniae]